MHDCPFTNENKQGGLLPEHWHLDKKVPIALIGALLIQAGTIIWWASGLEGRMTSYDRRISANEAEISKTDSAQDTITERLTRIEERTSATNAMLTRIEAYLSIIEEKRIK